MNRRTVVVEGPLAFRMRRLMAARQNEAGVEITTMPLLAARLMGGFARPPLPHDLFTHINAALEAGGFADFESLRHLPGMARSLAKTLSKIWLADLSLVDVAPNSKRLADLALIEERVRARLPAGVRLLPDLRNAAMANVRHAPSLFGAIEFQRLTYVPPVWRPLVRALASVTSVSWKHPGVDDVGWFTGTVAVDEAAHPPSIDIASCADPRAEVLEALRWARELISTGRAAPEEIAICSAATPSWDPHVLALAATAELPVHFSHGVPTLASYDGQACSALADILLNGLSQERVRRLLRYRQSLNRVFGALPDDWSRGIARSAALFEVEQWRRVLDIAGRDRGDGVDIPTSLMPALEALAGGVAAARAVGEFMLRRDALLIWAEALERAPATALEYSLQESRLPDGRDPGASVVWCPAGHLAAAPRLFVWLLGMNARSWPRRQLEDPLVPSHILPRSSFDADPVAEQDRRTFRLITRNAAGECVLSISRRSAEGTLLAVSPLVAVGARRRSLRRGRIPAHALSEGDRLLARPLEAATEPAIIHAMSCWRDWQQPQVTAHDGRLRIDHPVILRAIEDVQSATSLRLMLRDPLGFVWHYGLGWRPLPEEQQPLTLDLRAYGELVHELLKRAVDTLEPRPGYTRAARHELENALTAAKTAIREQWPLERAVPPALLWNHFLDTAAQLALNALIFDEAFQTGTRSWTEVAFGLPASHLSTAITLDLPWSPTSSVSIPSTNMFVRGSIDRLDLTRTGNAVRVSDYKTGAKPRNADQIVLAGGAELQRVVYALAANQLLPEAQRVVARLVFLQDAKPTAVKLADVEDAIRSLATHVTAAITSLQRGMAVPGPDTAEERNDFRLALPAGAASYLALKRSALHQALGDFSRTWSAP